MNYRVYLVDSIGVATSIIDYETLEEAESEVEYLMDCRTIAQTLDGTTFEVRKESGS
jgi:hypothetical protein